MQWPHGVLERMRRRHVLELVEEGDPDEDIDIPLRNFKKKRNGKKAKKT